MLTSKVPHGHTGQTKPVKTGIPPYNAWVKPEQFKRKFLRGCKQ